MQRVRMAVDDSQSLVLEARASVARASTALGGGDTTSANLHLFTALQALARVPAGVDGVNDRTALLLLRQRLVGVRMSSKGDLAVQLNYLSQVRDAIDGLR